MLHSRKEVKSKNKQQRERSFTNTEHNFIVIYLDYYFFTGKKVHDIKMETDRYVLKIKMETLSKIADNKARIIAIRNETEKYAGEKLAAKRNFEIELERLENIKKLATNPNVLISGETGDNAIAQLVATTRAASLLGIQVSKK